MALAPQQFCVRWNSYHTNLQAVFPRLLSTEHFADVTLACEARQLRCHKLVLSACSAYFERLLVQNPCKHPIVFMKDMRFSEMQALVDFMYKGEVNVTQEELPSLLKSAEALQIRGLCSGETNGLTTDSSSTKSPDGAGKDYTLASDVGRESGLAANGSPKSSPTANGAGPAKKRKSDPDECRPASVTNDVKQETVEEDGLYYGELNMDYNEDEETGKPGGSLGQSSVANPPFVRVKPESELFLRNALRNIDRDDTDYLSRLSKMNAKEIRSEFAKYGFTTAPPDATAQKPTEDYKPNSPDNDFYKSWLEQNGELEVSLLRASDKAKKPKIASGRSEVELIPKGPNTKLPDYPQIRRRGRPPIFKDRNVDIGDTILKSDLDQFLEGKEVSSSGLSRKDLERVMMGKFNPNRRYSNEAMWAALMDVKKGGSIYRAAQTHKVPRKSLRNWMKRCHIKSSFPMPQQLKQFVENSKKQKEYRTDGHPSHYEPFEQQHSLGVEDFGKHFLTFTGVASSEDENGQKKEDEPSVAVYFAIANVQCHYDNPSETECDPVSEVDVTVARGGDDHNYDGEPPAFIIQQVRETPTPVQASQSVQTQSQPFVEVTPKIMTLGPGYVPSVNVIHVGDTAGNTVEHHPSTSAQPELNRRIRRSEALLGQAADCVSRGLTFQMVSEQFNIPISTIRFFMARKGILPQRRRGRNSHIPTLCSSPEPPFHMQHFKLPAMVALKEDGEDENSQNQ